MLVVTRYRVEPSAGAAFQVDAQAALAALAARPGYRSGRLGRAADDVTLWVLATEWDGVGAYRRALSSAEVKAAAVPVLARALDEPTAFEVLLADGRGADGLAVERPAATGEGR